MDVALVAGTAFLPWPFMIAILFALFCILAISFAQRYLPHRRLITLIKHLDALEEAFRINREEDLLLDPAFVDSLDLEIRRYVAGHLARHLK